MGKLKHFEIVFHSDKDVFYPGDKVNGQCVLDLCDEFKIKAVKATLRGVARAHWTEMQSSGATGNFAVYTEKRINSEHEYIFEKKILYDSDNDNRTNGIFQKGIHKFEFSFQLPESGVPTSFEGKFGNVRYWIKSEIEKPWSFDYGTKKAFTLISPIDINRSEYLIPVEKSVEKSLSWLWCICTSGTISLYANTERTGYCPGESIAISAQFENLTRRTVIPQATLFQTQHYLADRKIRSRKIKFTKVTGVAIQPRKSATWDGQLLKIPPISPSILNCRLIRIEYIVRVSLIPFVGNICFVDLPVVLGTVPLSQRTVANVMPTSCQTSVSLANRIETPTHTVYHHPQEHNDRSVQSMSMNVGNIRHGTPPPTYADCIDGSVDIDDDEEQSIGNTRFTPRYIYVNNRPFCPPPAYSKFDPYPAESCS